MVSDCFYSKVTVKISQIEGLRDPECGCTCEPFGFIKQWSDGIKFEKRGDPEGGEK